MDVVLAVCVCVCVCVCNGDDDREADTAPVLSQNTGTLNTVLPRMTRPTPAELMGHLQ